MASIARFCWLGLVLALGAGAATAALLDEARALHREGRLAEALRAYRAVYTEAGADPADAGTARNNACVILMDLGRHRAAEEQCRRALELRRDLGDEVRIGRTLNNLGLALQNLGRFDDSERAFGEALAINRRLGDAGAEVINLANLGALATLAGRYDRAIASLDEAARIAADRLDEPWAAEQQHVARVNRGVVLEKLGAFHQALELYREVLAAGDRLDARKRAALLLNLGVVYRNLGDPVTALDRFAEAAEIYRGVGDASGLSTALLNVGLARHLNLGQLDGAEEAYREALRLAEEAGDRPEVIRDLFYLGGLMADRGEMAEAEALFARCLELAVESGSAEGRWSARAGLGRVALAGGRPQEALSHFDRAIGDIEGARARIPRRRLRSGFFGDKRTVYASAVEALAELDDSRPGMGFGARALELVQRAKARDLLDALGPSGRSASPVTAAQLRRLVGGDLLLEYFVGASSLWAWSVGRDGIELFDLGEARPHLARVSEVHAALARGAPPDDDALAALSRGLLRGLEGVAGRGRTLWIAPDGALHYLPFELLETPGRPGSPLVEAAALAYLPSGSALKRSPADLTPEALAFAGLGDPDLAPAGRAGFSLSAISSRFRLEALPGARGELATIAGGFPEPREVRTGGEASEEALRGWAQRGARVLHLAAHAVVDESSERGAAILLAPGGAHDGLVHPDEIAALRFPAGLTVLAACSTRMGSHDEGRALSSLTGSFLAAGSAGVVATLWDVGDAATAAFMEQFYYHLGRGLPPAEALRRTKRTMRAHRDWSAPALWSGYVLVGRGEGLPRERQTLLWSAAAGLSAVLLWTLWRGLRNRRRSR